MPKVHHPRIPDISYEVSDANRKKWLDAGWRATKPKTTPGDSANNETSTEGDS